jgi:predicted DNA-binding transcriptional regulator AlpA
MPRRNTSTLLRRCLTVNSFCERIGSVHHLAGVHEVAELLGVSRQRVYKLMEQRPDFPTPTAVLRGGSVWEAAEIVRWAAANPRRPGRPRSGSRS